MQSTMFGRRIIKAFPVLFRLKPHLSHARCMQTRASRKTGPIENATRLDTSSVHKKQGPLAFLWRSRREKVDEDWFHGPETIVYHVPKLHVFFRLTAIFPAFVVVVTLYNLDTIWNHGVIENPRYNKFQPTPEQPRYIRKPFGDRVLPASVTVGGCVLVLWSSRALGRAVIRTISFRTDHAAQAALRTNKSHKAPNADALRRMVCLTSISGKRRCYPIDQLKLSNAKRLDILLLKAPRKIWPFLFEVEAAQIGWPGVSSMVEPFAEDEGRANGKDIEDKREAHNLYAKQLFALLWHTHAGVDLSRTNTSKLWA